MDMSKLLSASLLMAMLITSPVHAIPISGSFSGLASGIIDAEDPVNGRDFFDEPTTGTFRFESELVGDVYDETYAIVVLNQPVTLTFDLFGRHLEFDSSTSGWPTMTLNRGGQILGLGADQGPYYHANLWLVSRADSVLYRDLDLSTFDGTQIDSLNSSASFFAGRSFVGTVQLDRVSVDGVQVPEPSSLVLFLAGLGVVAAARRNRAPKRCHGQSFCGLRV